MQPLDHDRLRNFLFDELPQPHPGNRGQRRLSGCRQRRQDKRDENNDDLNPGRGVQEDLLEEFADRAILVHPQDRLSEQWRHGKNFYLGMLFFRW